MPSAPLRLILDSDALLANWRWLGGMSGRAACGAAVKADGYGLGAKSVTRRLIEAGCRDFFVATWAEALALGAMPGGVSIAVLHGIRTEDLRLGPDFPARPVLNSPAMVALWKAVAPHRACDVMIDTGMNRLGLTPEEARSGLLDGLVIDTLMSHLACADEPDNAMNEQQLFTFRGLRGAIPAARYSLANSAGVCLGRRFSFGLTRPGIAIYGGVPAAAAVGHIHPVARIEAQVIQTRSVPVGGTVGYGATWRAAAKTKLAILNIGYADGYLRAFTGNGVAHAGDRPCPLVGRVSMDLVAADIGDATDIGEGDWLAIDYDLPRAAAATGLSQYELLTGLGHRYQRRWT